MQQQAWRAPAGFEGPRLEAHDVVSFDGAQLGAEQWMLDDGEPWAVIVGVHGMDDNSNAFDLPAPTGPRTASRPSPTTSAASAARPTAASGRAMG